MAQTAINWQITLITLTQDLANAKEIGKEIYTHFLKSPWQNMQRKITGCKKVLFCL